MPGCKTGMVACASLAAAQPVRVALPLGLWGRLQAPDENARGRLNSSNILFVAPWLQEFRKPDSETFIFLLSIRAAGRGLNLQTSDTVIIYDPDHNPKNEEQAIARAHRIGQTKEVRACNAASSNSNEQRRFLYLCCSASRSAGPSRPLLIAWFVLPKVRVFFMESVPEADDGGAESSGGKKGYADSIESLIRNTIQKIKIDMANEVIDAGRFDGQTTNEERKQSLETLLADAVSFLRSSGTTRAISDISLNGGGAERTGGIGGLAISGSLFLGIGRS